MQLLKWLPDKQYWQTTSLTMASVYLRLTSFVKTMQRKPHKCIVKLLHKLLALMQAMFTAPLL